MADGHLEQKGPISFFKDLFMSVLQIDPHNTQPAPGNIILPKEAYPEPPPRAQSSLGHHQLGGAGLGSEQGTEFLCSFCTREIQITVHAWIPVVGPGRPMGSIVYGLILRESRELLYRTAQWNQKSHSYKSNRHSLDL